MMTQSHTRIWQTPCAASSRSRIALTLFFMAMLLGLSVAEDKEPNPELLKLHRVTFEDAKSELRTVEARVLIEAQDSGLLLEARDGRLWQVASRHLRKNLTTDDLFKPLPADELGRQLQCELTELGIESPSIVVVTKHYVICTTAGRKYAEWVSGLFERLHDGFRSFWKTHGLELRDVEFPLPAIVLKDQTEFAALATKHDGPDAAQSHGGYFSIPTNRVVMFDLTATPGTPPAKTFPDIQKKIATSPFNVATIIHEATHQLAFNSGLHTRFADNPMWLAEGMAMFFEVPDLENHAGWKTMGRVNPLRLKQVRESFSKRREDDQQWSSLIRMDDRFQDVQQAEAAYAEAWLLTYYLLKTRKADYVTYLKRIAAKPRLVLDSPDDRIREFYEVFGDNLDKLDHDLRRYATKLK